MREASQQDTREAILDATDRLLSQYGYKKMTIDDLAREVGIGKGSIYLHFSSKEDVALSHIDRIISRLKDRLDRIASGPGTFEVRLSKMLCERVLYRFDSVQHYTRGLDDLLSQIRARLLERRKKYFEEEAAIFAAVIEAGQKAGEFIEGQPAALANSLVYATNAFLPYSLSVNELGIRSEIAELTEQTSRLLIRGLKR